MMGELFVVEGRLGSSFLTRAKGRRWLGQSQLMDFDALTADNVPFGFGDVSMVYSSFMLLIS